MTTPEIAAATVPATGGAAEVTAPFFDPNRPPLTPLPAAPRRAVTPVDARHRPANARPAPGPVRSGKSLSPPARRRGAGQLLSLQKPDPAGWTALPALSGVFRDDPAQCGNHRGQRLHHQRAGQTAGFCVGHRLQYTWPSVYPYTREIYAEFGVPEYWRFDYTGGNYYDAALAGDRLTPAGVYEPILVERTPEGLYRGYSAALGLELHWIDRRLRFWNPAAGDYLPDLPEMAERWRAEAAAHQATADQLAAAQALIQQLQDRLALPE